MSDSFAGRWLVSEYVFDPDGRFVGVVRQLRSLERLACGRIRVTQVCEPGKSLVGHPMGAFAGKWVFELEAKGAERRYLGPDVVGCGREWSPGALTGEGIWPRFGYSFESFSVLTDPGRQLTGGFFSLAGRSVADIVGVATEDIAGVAMKFDAGLRWPELDLSPAPAPPDRPNAIWRRVGPMTVAESWPNSDERLRLLEISDPAAARSVVISDRRIAGVQGVEVGVIPSSP